MRARNVFPLSLAQLPVGLAGLARNPIGIGLGVIPIGVKRGVRASAPPLIVWLIAAAVGEAGVPP
jgi:hypothetical protein